MGRIVAISGGNLSSTRSLNQYAISLTNKKKANVLFIGTASKDAKEYIDIFRKEYIALGCEVKSLCLCSRYYEEKEIDELLTWADIIYVGGGDTVFMMKIWEKYNINSKLKRIYENDLAVLTGISAGAICWFTCGHSDSESFYKEDNWNYCWADEMLDLIHMAFCPHYNEEGRESFDKMLREKHMTGLAMENDTAFVENQGEQYYIKCNSDANAYLMMYQNSVLKKQKVKFDSL